VDITAVSARVPIVAPTDVLTSVLMDTRRTVAAEANNTSRRTPLILTTAVTAADRTIVRIVAVHILVLAEVLDPASAIAHWTGPFLDFVLLFHICHCTRTTAVVNSSLVLCKISNKISRLRLYRNQSVT
jgi:hypothetical protein